MPAALVSRASRGERGVLVHQTPVLVPAPNLPPGRSDDLDGKHMDIYGENRRLKCSPCLWCQICPGARGRRVLYMDCAADLPRRGGASGSRLVQLARVGAETASRDSCSSSDAEVLQFLKNERTGPRVRQVWDDSNRV